MLALLAALSLLSQAQTAPAKPIVPVDQATWNSLIAKALAQPPRDDGPALVYAIHNNTPIGGECPAGTKPENKLWVFKQKSTRYPLIADVNIQIVCTDSRGFLAAGVFVWARSDDRTITSEDMYTGDADPKKASKVIIESGKLAPSVVDLPVLQDAIAQALRSLNAP